MTESLSFWTRVGLLSFILTLSFQLTLHATPETPNTNRKETVSCDVNGGYLSDRWLRTERVICAGDGNEDPIDVLLQHAYGTNSAWVITDPNGNILGIPPGPPFDLEGAGQGTCLVWHVSFEGELSGVEVGKNANDIEGCYDLSNPLTIYRNGVNGGTISTNDPTHICAGDGQADPINVYVEGSEGPNAAWVITDQAGKILALPPAPPFDFEGAGEGVCLIWYLRYEGPIDGLATGKNANNFRGCFDLSNPITVYRDGVDGGHLTTAGGMTEKTICAGDGESDAFGVNLTGVSGANSAWVITDDALNILALPPAPPFDLEGAGAGTCLIWHLSYEDGLMGAAVGMNAANLEGCYDLSNPITVYRETGDDCEDTCHVSGGHLTTAGGMTEKMICAGDGESDAFDVIISGQSSSHSAWVITDDMGKILALPPAPPFDLEGAGAGTCLIWYLAFDGEISGVEVGMNAADLEGCYELSNPITVVRKTGSDCEADCNVNGGYLTDTYLRTTRVICAGDGYSDAFDIRLSGQMGSNSAWVITDEAGNILALPPAPPFDLEGAGSGTCLIWHLSFDGEISGAEVGMNTRDLEGCYDLSNPYTVYRNGVNGGTISTNDNTHICAGDGQDDLIDVYVEGAEGPKAAWVITDEAGKILALPAAPPFNFEGAGEGVCLIWYLRYEGPLEGLEMGKNANDFRGCFDLSNPITVYRETGEDCEETCEVEGGELVATLGGTYNRVVIANRASGTISAINSDNNEIVGTFDMPNDGEPMYAVYNSDNRTVLVGDYAGKVVAFDAVDYSVKGSVNAGAGVFHMWLSPNNKQLWVNNELDRTISVIDPTNMTNIATVALPQDLYDAGYKPHDVILMPNNAAAFVSLLGPGPNDYVIKYDTEHFQETGRAAVGTDPHVSLTGANDKLYVASQGSSELKVLKRSDLSEVETVMIPNAHGLGMNIDGSYLYVGNIAEGGTNATYTLDLKTNNLVGNPVDAPFSAPHNYAVTGDNQKLFLTHSGANDQVSIYTLNPSPTLINSVTVGDNPFGLVAYTVHSAAEEATELTICAGDGISDAFDVNLTGATGANSAWVITDDALNILALPAAPPFDLEGAGAGTCLIWHLSFEDGLMGAAVGMNAANLEGCYDLSNPITVYRETGEDCETACDVDGGHIYTNDATTICAGDGEDDFVNVNLSGAAGANSAWVITDNDGYILALPAAPPFNFEGAGAGVCLIWHLSFDGAISGAEVGQNAADLEGCYQLSNSIKVIRRTSGHACGRYNNNSHSLTVDLAPNPVSTQLRVDITIGEGGNFRTSTIEILTSIGRRVYRRTEATYDGDNRVNIDVSNLQPGVYFLRVRNGSQREVVRFVKQ